MCWCFCVAVKWGVLYSPVPGQPELYHGLGQGTAWVRVHFRHFINNICRWCGRVGCRHEWEDQVSQLFVLLFCLKVRSKMDIYCRIRSSMPLWQDFTEEPSCLNILQHAHPVLHGQTSNYKRKKMESWVSSWENSEPLLHWKLPLGVLVIRLNFLPGVTFEGF